MNGDCCDGEHYQTQDDMGAVYCSFWGKEFNENYDSLCEMCEEMGGPCTDDDVEEAEQKQ